MAAPSSTSTVPVSPDDRPLGVDLILHIVLGVLLVVVVGFSVMGWLGVSTTVTSATAGGFTLEVEHAAVTRPGISTALEIRVTRAEGLPGEVVIEMDPPYVLAFDLNAISPEPAEQFNDGEVLRWTFSVPRGATTLAAAADARLDPSVQSTQTTDVTVVVDGQPTVSVVVTTRVVP